MSRPHRHLICLVPPWLLAWPAAFLACSLPALVRGTEPSRPNFVFICTDDQRWDALGVVQREQGQAARFPWLKTPNMDRLAFEGVRFRNAFVVNSLCSPSRASFLTGRYGHLNGIVNNHTPFPADSVTHARLLREAGYRTGYVGKWHMGAQRGPRPGFDFSASYVGQGRYVDNPFEVDGQETATRGWIDDVSADYAVRFLRESQDRPFLLVVGFKSAHNPFDPPERVKDAYAGEMARPVPNLYDPAAYMRTVSTKPPIPEGAGGVPTNLGYFRCLTAADESLGRILRALDELRLADDTMVIFAGDNGYYLGEHREQGDKRSAYEESLRIPLLVRYPRLVPGGQTIDGMVLNIDLAPTLLDYAGVNVPDQMQGRSWRPLCEGRGDGWRKAFFYDYFYERGFRTPMVTAVRTETAKLIRYPGHDEWAELFDLAADPYETRNLIADPGRAALRRELETEYARQQAAIGFRIPAFADDPDQDVAGIPMNAWVLQYDFDQDVGDEVVDATGRTNHGQAKGAPLAEGRGGHKARRFDGRGFIEVPRSASLNPAVGGWTVDVVFKAEADTGVVLACGGQRDGYALHLMDGRPAFTVVVQDRATQIAGRRPVAGDWVRVRAQITADKRLQLLVDGKPVAEGQLPAALGLPDDDLQIGVDLGSPVLFGREVPPLMGLIESVRVHSGGAP